MGDCQRQATNFGEWWPVTIQAQDEGSLRKAAMVFWCIWEHRNAKIWNKSRMLESQFIDSALSLLDQWEQSHMPASTNMGHNHANGKKWEPPKQGLFKCNIDAAISQRDQRIGFGCIVRNEKGEMIAAKNGSMTVSDQCVRSGSFKLPGSTLMGKRQRVGKRNIRIRTPKHW